MAPSKLARFEGLLMSGREASAMIRVIFAHLKGIKPNATSGVWDGEEDHAQPLH
jgi:hypothetical protein